MQDAEAKRYETFTDWLRARAAFLIDPIVAQLGRWGFHPNTLTLMGFALTVVVAGVLASGWLAVSGVLLLLVSSIDAMDGALARAINAKSRFGAFLDSTLDRMSEGALLGGLLAWTLMHAAPQDVSLNIYLIFASLLGSVMVSYTRARAEGVGYTCKVGIFTRVERVLLLSVGLLAGQVQWMLILLVVLTWITVGQRIWYVYRESRQNP